MKEKEKARESDGNENVRRYKVNTRNESRECLVAGMAVCGESKEKVERKYMEKVIGKGKVNDAKLSEGNPRNKTINFTTDRERETKEKVKREPRVPGPKPKPRPELSRVWIWNLNLNPNRVGIGSESELEPIFRVSKIY